jgi:two-component system, chemotaxis family, chemotaxis protein CheY
MKKVVIVDNMAFMRGTLKNLLVKNGFNVIGEACDGSSALELCSNLKPDIVTMDLSITRNESFNTIACIQKSTPISKIVVVTAMIDETSLKNALSSGAHALIKKPYVEKNILQILNKL